MESLFREFDNENALRSYPFAAGCALPYEGDNAIPAEVFVDAVLYPVNPVGILYLSSVSKDGVFSVSDDSGVIMTGTASGASVEFYDKSDAPRHVGTLMASSELALSEFMNSGAERSYTREETAFASSCVFPVVVDGVTSLSVGGTGKVRGDGLKFTNGNQDAVRVSSRHLGPGRKTLRFDVLPYPDPPDMKSIRRITCVVDGKTPFRISRPEGDGSPYNVIALSLAGIDKEVVCAAAHRENAYEMSDTCGCEKDIPSGKSIGDTYQVMSVDIPPNEAAGRPYGAYNAFFLVVPNTPEYANPLSLTLEDGAIIPKIEDPEVVVDGLSAELAEGEMRDDTSSKAVVLQVPGLSGGGL